MSKSDSFSRGMKEKTKYKNTYVLGIPIAKLTMAEVVSFLVNAVETKIQVQIITLNPIMLMQALKDDELTKVMLQSELNIADGAGVVWASTYLGDPVPERVAGYDLMHRLLRIADQKKWRVFMLGSKDEIVKEAASNVSKMYSNLYLSGYDHGYFSEEEDSKMIETINNSNAHILLVARSVDKQEKWIAKYKDQLNVPIMIGVGGSFDVLSGKLQRAPLFLQKLRLEWLFRLLQEPRRYKRMLVLPKFVFKILYERNKLNK